jgi:hypothetical protein
LCPTADDIWLHANAIREGIRIKQVRTWPRCFPEFPGTQDVALGHVNFREGRNDLQIAKTYTSDDLAVLRNEANGCLGSKQWKAT